MLCGKTGERTCRDGSNYRIKAGFADFKTCVSKSRFMIKMFRTGKIVKPELQLELLGLNQIGII